MGSAGTGKTLMLTEALKIKISRLKENGKLKIFVTTFRETYTELQDKYKNHYLANLRQNITFTTIPSLCADLKIEFHKSKPQQTLNLMLQLLSEEYSDSTVIILCDEVRNAESEDWSDMKTWDNVIWLLAINPRSIDRYVMQLRLSIVITVAMSLASTVHIKIYIQFFYSRSWYSSGYVCGTRAHHSWH